MPAQLANGREVDLWRKSDAPAEGSPWRVDWSRPQLISAMYKNDRWRKYMVMLADMHCGDRRLLFAQWLSRRWNAQHPAEEQILTFQIFLMLEKTVPREQREPAKPVLLWAGQAN